MTDVLTSGSSVSFLGFRSLTTDVPYKNVLMCVRGTPVKRCCYARGKIPPFTYFTCGCVLKNGYPLSTNCPGEKYLWLLEIWCFVGLSQQACLQSIKLHWPSQCNSITIAMQRTFYQAVLNFIADHAFQRTPLTLIRPWELTLEKYGSIIL